MTPGAFPAVVVPSRSKTGGSAERRSSEESRRTLSSAVTPPTGTISSSKRPASCAAFEARSGKLCGISLASLVAPDCGHITQICVSPQVRGTGIGYALLRQSLKTLKDMGCRSASLTVTANNDDAVNLYLRVGFETVKRFSAFVWEDF